MRYYHDKCEVCGEAFYGNKTQKFCSQKCSGVVKRGEANPSWKGGLHHKVCAVCGKAFSTKHKDQKACSVACGAKVRSSYKGGPWRRTCVTCGKEFVTGHQKVKACSYRCGVLSRRNRTGKNDSVEKQCIVCGKTFSGPRRVETCSRECGYKTRPNYKGGRVVTVAGYVWIKAKSHPNCNSRGYVNEHRLVMEDELGRLLHPWEDVHHINGIKSDNRPENLEIVSHANHYGQVPCPYCARKFRIK